MLLPKLLFFTDVEAYGPSPFSGEMTEFGCVVADYDRRTVVGSFHGVLIDAPLTVHSPVPVVTESTPRFDERKVMTDFQQWVNSFDVGRTVFISDNPAYDYQWVNYYFDKYGLKNPFGHSARRIGDFYAGVTGKVNNTGKWKRYCTTMHDHNPVHDATGNVEAFFRILDLMEERQLS